MAQGEAKLRRPGSFLGMMVAVGIVVVIVLVVFGLNNKPASFDPKPVDFTSSLEVAKHAGVIDAQAPKPVPEGWVATSAKYELVSTHPTKQAQWTMGFVTPEGEFVGIRQGNGDSTKFIREMTVNGEPEGKQLVDGQEWVRYTSADTDNRSLVYVGPKQTTVVTGTVTWEQLGEVAASLAS